MSRVGGREQLLRLSLGDPGHVGREEGFVEPPHGFLFAERLLVDRLERTAPVLGRDPLGTDADDVFMQPRR